MKTNENQLKSLLEQDIEAVVAWGECLRPEDRPHALMLAARLAHQDIQPSLKLHALGLIQSCPLGTPLDPDVFKAIIVQLLDEIETTECPEVQHACVRASVVLLADVEESGISQELFGRAVSLFRCLERVATQPHARDFIRSVLGHDAPLGKRVVQWIRARKFPVWAFSGGADTEHKAISRAHAERFGLPWVSFGEFVRSDLEKNREKKGAALELLDHGERLLVQLGADELCKRVFARAENWNKGLPIVIDGVRHKEVLEALRRFVAPCDVLMVSVVEPDSTKRWERLVRKFGAKNVPRIQRHSTERQIGEVLRELAAVVIQDPKTIVSPSFLTCQTDVLEPR